jgi:SAM-dependent methyltransferase
MCHERPGSLGGFTAFAPRLQSGEVAFNAGFFEGLRGIEDGHFWFETRNDLIAWALRRFAPSATAILEVGCGTGFVLRRLRQEYPSADLTAGEVLPAGLEVAKSRVPSASLYQMDARAIPFVSEFDVIGAFDVLEHIDRDQDVISQVAQALVPNGTFIVSVPQHPMLWTDQDVHAGHFRRYSAGQLTAKLSQHGLAVVWSSSFMSILLPAIYLVRKLPVGRGDEAAAESVEALNYPRRLSPVLRAICRVERALIAAGVRFPAGGSLLVVARKVSQSGRAS